MKKFISRLHYLTQDLENRSHLEQAKIACEAGCKWLQYRCLSKSDDQMLEDLHQIASICDDWGSTLIVTDHIHLLGKADIQGVHIEDMKADFKSIRMQIGAEKNLGASANSFDDIQIIVETQSVDYIGCGPFSLTDTKPNEYELLGAEGYKLIVERMQSANFELPILAVGGIRIEEVDSILKTGVYGIAVSAAINKADSPAKAFKDFYRKLY